MQQAVSKHLHRSRTNKMLTGVIGGLAETFGIDATLLRLVTLLLFIPFSLVIGVLYLALSLMLPQE
jgi:phage shock protein C